MSFPAGGYADATAAIADGMLHYWPMDEESGVVVADAVGDLDGESITGGYAQTNSIQPGLFGNGRYCFEHISELGSKGIKITPASGEGTGELAAFSVSIWVNPEWVDGFYSYAGFGYPFSVGQVAFGCDNPGKLWLQYGAAGELYFESAGGVVSTGSWSLLALTYDGSTIRLYHNNVEIYSASTAATRLRHRYGWSALGALPDPNIYGVGYDALATIDDAGIWNRALSPTEISNIWNAGAGVPLVGAAGPATADFTIDADLDELGSEFTTFANWTVVVDPIVDQLYYACVVTGAADALPDLRLPISSWQATVQNGRADYVQAVVPAIMDLVDAIGARSNGEIVIYRGARSPDGSEREIEMARAPLEQFRIDRGSFRATGTLSGYAAITTNADPSTRTLTGLRSLSIDGSGVRARTDIDWLLRPGMMASVGEYAFEVSYINYYVGNNQAYMDVGERNG